MSDDTKKQLQTQLWNIANTLRGKMGADEFRDYILGFIFYKYLSERMHLFADEILKHDGIQFDQIDETKKQGKEMLAAIQEEAIERLGYFLKPSELFHKVAEKGARKKDNFILGDLGDILKHIEASTMGHASEDDFEGLFEDLDLGSSKLGKTESQKNDLIAKVLSHLDKIDFGLADTDADVLGDAYEYLIGQFASGAGKKAGEFYTPQEVSTILARIVTTGKKRLKSVYDPTCGSASLLLRVAKEVKDVGKFYGQEMNPTTFNLARMNMILHGVHYQRFDLKNEDTLEHPAPEHADLRFEAIVANPPFSADWSASAIHESDDRFSPYGRLAPKSKADFAFVQHMVHHLDNGGTMACVLPHGVLYRGAAEGHIRKYLIEDCNYLDAVIGLPENIFYGTNIATCILVLKKQRKNTNDILFINASLGFEKVGNQNHLRPEDIERIVSTYQKRESIAKFSHVATLSEIEKHDYNLNITRYVDNFAEDEQVNLAETSAQLKVLETEMALADETIKKFCAELGLPLPEGCNSNLLAQYKKGVLQTLFAKGVRFKDDNGNCFPDWKETPHGEIYTFKNTNSYSRDMLTYDVGEVRNIHYGDIHTKFRSNFYLAKEKVPFIKPDVDISRISEDCYCRVGDLVIADASEDYADVGKCIEIMDLGGERTLAGLHTFIARPKKGLIAPGFGGYLMQAREVRLKIMRIAQGTKVLGLSKSYLAQLLLPLPCTKEQTKIANFLSAIDRKIDSVSNQFAQPQGSQSGLSK
jgi:type I restriction enzyme M protein